MRVIQVVGKNEDGTDRLGSKFDAVEFTGTEFDAVEREVTRNPETGEKGMGYFIETKDPEGHKETEGKLAEVAIGMIVLVNEDGERSICHPSVLSRQFKQVSE